MLKELTYPNRDGSSNPHNKLVYAVLDHHCYFSIVGGESATPITLAAEPIIKAIAHEEDLFILVLRYFDLQTHLNKSERINPGEHLLEEICVEKDPECRFGFSVEWERCECPPRILALFKDLIGVAAPAELERRYRSGSFKRGYAEEVDLAIVAASDALRASKETFLVEWQKLLAVLAASPNPSFWNLMSELHPMRGHDDLKAETILLYQIALTLEPGNAETMSGLGQAYSALGQYDRAAAAHVRAYELAVDYAKSQKADASNPLWADAAIFLTSAGEAEERAGKLEEALAHGIRALQIFINGNTGWDKTYTLKPVARVAARLNLHEFSARLLKQAEEEEHQRRKFHEGRI